MEAASAFFDSRARSDWSFDALKNFRKISPAVQSHLQRVYATLAAALVISTFGVYVHTLWNIGGILTIIGFIACAVGLLSVPFSPANESTKLKLLAGAAFFEGASVGTLVDAVLKFNPSIVITAFLGSVTIFACFTGASLLARRREYLFLGGILSSALSTLVMLKFCSFLFGGGVALFNLELYGGLLLFLGYVLFDTQMIIERADHGDRDYVKHSLDLFVDFVDIFVRLLVILTKKECDRKEERRRGNTTRR